MVARGSLLMWLLRRVAMSNLARSSLAVLVGLCLLASHSSGQGKRPPLPTDLTRRVDRYGDLLPAGVICSLGTQRFRGGGENLAFSPDGKTIASGAGSIRVFNSVTGSVIKEAAQRPGVHARDGVFSGWPTDRHGRRSPAAGRASFARLPEALGHGDRRRTGQHLMDRGARSEVFALPAGRRHDNRRQHRRHAALLGLGNQRASP